jgi:multidrug efflux system membrane fusion protein
MVTINQIRPIEVFFSIPQAELPAVRKQMAVRKLKVMASLPQDTRPPEAGDLFFIDNTIDKTTGTVQLAGTFSNDREVLWPGQYVNVTLVLSIQRDALVVPSVAVQTGREGKFVFAVKPDNTVEVRSVIARMAAGEETVIEKGLQAGERVVTDGQLGLVPGSRIDIKNDLKSNSKTPGGRS